MHYPKVFIILLQYNYPEYTIECIRSLQKLDYPNYEIVVVDNASSSETQEAIKRHFPQIPLIRNKKNLGYTGGNNVGIRYSLQKGADYIYILNNDTIVAKNSLKKLVEMLQSNPEIGAVMPKIYYYDKPDTIQGAGCKISVRRGLAGLVGTNEIDRGQYERVTETDYISGCALLTKKEVIEKVGLFDENYFIYYDDVDWSVRARQSGFKLFYIPQATIWHKGAATTGGGSRNPFFKAHGIRSRILFVRKHTSKWNLLFFFLPYFLIRIVLFHTVKFILQNRWDLMISMFKGIRWNLSHRRISPKGTSL